jgi:hypothetical protein
MLYKKSFILSLLLLIGVSFTAAQERYFYTGKNYGSESLYNPIYLLLNGSYDILQLEGMTKDITKYPYSNGMKWVFNSLSRPFKAIEKYGWREFMLNEIIPFNFDRKHSQWWPNYNLHLIGGGMTFVRTEEWYMQHGFSNPQLYSIATMAFLHLLNEVVESAYVNDLTIDPVSDIYIFDIGGMILFSFDGVKKFFSQKLNLNDWSLIPAFSLTDGTLQNNGQYFVMKYQMGETTPWHLFYFFGLDGILGATYKFENGEAISAGFGFRGKKRIVEDHRTNRQSVTLAWNFGLFYDQDNSLLASVFFSGIFNDFLHLNIYPGIIKLGDFSPGVLFALSQDGKPTFGITTMWTPGIAVNAK